METATIISIGRGKSRTACYELVERLIWQVRQLADDPFANLLIIRRPS
jgi:hypothetical protein